MSIDEVVLLIWWLALGWLVVCEAALVYAIIAFRKRDGVRASWLPATTGKALAWIYVPVLLVLGCDLYIDLVSNEVWDEVKVDLPAHDLLVKVTARQFAWDFTYAGDDGVLGTDDDYQSVSEFHVPKDAVVRFQLESKDVLHSFFVRELRLKQDVVPGRSIPGWFEAIAEGTYEIACAEICGASHTMMRGELIVHSAESWLAWSRNIAGQQALLGQGRGN
jgi:cytochrome c oxidase subunit 2